MKLLHDIVDEIRKLLKYCDINTLTPCNIKKYCLKKFGDDLTKEGSHELDYIIEKLDFIIEKLLYIFKQNRDEFDSSENSHACSILESAPVTKNEVLDSESYKVIPLKKRPLTEESHGLVLRSISIAAITNNDFIYNSVSYPIEINKGYVFVIRPDKDGNCIQNTACDKSNGHNKQNSLKTTKEKLFLKNVEEKVTPSINKFPKALPSASVKKEDPPKRNDKRKKPNRERADIKKTQDEGNEHSSYDTTKKAGIKKTQDEGNEHSSYNKTKIAEIINTQDEGHSSCNKPKKVKIEKNEDEENEHSSSNKTKRDKAKKNQDEEYEPSSYVKNNTESGKRKLKQEDDTIRKRKKTAELSKDTESGKRKRKLKQEDDTIRKRKKTSELSKTVHEQWKCSMEEGLKVKIYKAQ